MSDNTQLPPGTGGDLIRTVAKTANAGAKTQAVALDVGGGADGSPETILTAGTQAKAGSISVTPASDLSNIEPAGAAITGATMPDGGIGLTGWLSAIWSKLSGTLAVSAASLPLPTGAAADGTDNGGVSQPSGGTGIRGWLSAIYSKLMSSVAVTGTFWQATQPVSLPDNTTGTGSVSSASVLFSVSTTGYSALSVCITSAGSGNAIVYDGSNDNVNWVSGVTLYAAGSYFANPWGSQVIAANASSYVPVAYAYMRCRVSTYGSGTVTAVYTLKSSPVSGWTNIANTISNALYSKMTDGANTAAVKAASTAPAAADPALVVALSPNSSAALAAGSNTIGSVNVLGGNATAVKTDGSAVTQPVSGSVSLLDNTSVSVSVTSATILFSVDTLGTGSVFFSMTSMGSGCMIVSEYSHDNTNWILSGVITQGIAQNASSPYTTALFSSYAGYRYFRVRVSVYGSGTVTSIYQLRPIPSGTPVSAMQGGPAAINLAWYQKITDGVSSAAVKAASTAPAAADPALVVALSPNSPGVSATAVATVTTNASTTILSTATAGYQRLVVAITTTIAGATILFQGSNDNSTWFTVAATRVDSLTVAPAAGSTGGSGLGGGVIYSAPCDVAYLRMTASSSAWTGSVQWQLVNAPSNHVTVDQGAANGVPWSVTAAAVNAVATTSGLSQLAAVVAPATPATAPIKASAGRLILLDVGNAGTTDVWFKLWNLAQASVTLGTTAATTNLYIPKGTRQTFALADIGDFFSTAITGAVTGGISLTDNTAITASMVTWNARYI